MAEIKQFRTYKSKTFEGEGATRNLRIYLGNMHYENFDGRGDGVLGMRECDTQLVWDEARQGWGFLYNNFQPLFPLYADDPIFFRDVYQGRRQLIKLKVRNAAHVQGELKTDPIPAADIYRNYILYTDALGTGIDLILTIGSQSLRKLIRIREGFYPSSNVNFDFWYNLPNGADILYGDSLKTFAGTATDANKVPDSVQLAKVTARQSLYVGTDAGDGRDWYTVIQPVKIWDSTPLQYSAPNTATEPKRAFLPWKLAWDEINTVLVQRKTVPASFFAGAQGDVFTDAVITLADTQDSFYGTSFLTSGNGSATAMHVGGWGDNYYGFLQFDLTNLPQAGKINYCILWLNQTGTNTISACPQVALVTGSWSEATLTSSVNPAFNASPAFPFNEFPRRGNWPNTAGWRAADITTFARNWATGTTNNGVTVRGTQNNPVNSDTQYASRENADTTILPYLEVNHGVDQISYGSWDKRMLRHALKPRPFALGNAR